MYPHQRSNGGGIGEAAMGPGGDSRDDMPANTNNTNAVYGDFVSRNNPNDWLTPASPRSPSGRGRNDTLFNNHKHSRRTTATARLPSLRSMDLPEPMEPGVMTDGVAVGMGTMYDTDSQASGAGFLHGSSSHSHGYAQPAAAAAAVRGGGVDSYPPNAPYQEMMENLGRDYPTIDQEQERARISMAKRNSVEVLPPPQPGLPEKPNCQAMEPAIPASRLGRRMLTKNKPERKPDFVTANISGQSILSPLDYVVQCKSCQATVDIPKSAVVVFCPICDQVTPAASCRVVVRVGVGGHPL